jgi:hypothetical protein
MGFRTNNPSELKLQAMRAPRRRVSRLSHTRASRRLGVRLASPRQTSRRVVVVLLTWPMFEESSRRRRGDPSFCSKPRAPRRRSSGGMVSCRCRKVVHLAFAWRIPTMITLPRRLAYYPWQKKKFRALFRLRRVPSGKEQPWSLLPPGRGKNPNLPWRQGLTPW